MICSGAIVLALVGMAGCGTCQDDIEFSVAMARYEAGCAARPDASPGTKMGTVDHGRGKGDWLRSAAEVPVPFSGVTHGVSKKGEVDHERAFCHRASKMGTGTCSAFGLRLEPVPIFEPCADAGERQGENRPADLPWRQRTGRAYPGQFWPSLGHDALEWPETLISDVGATATNRVSLALLAAAGIGGAALANTDADDKVNDHYEKHGAQLGSLADDAGDIAGSAILHFGIAGSAYVAGLAFDDDETTRSAKTMVNALALTGVTTLGLKAAAGRDRPGGDRGGWPSGHASGSFCFATVVYHEYGFWPGAGAYAVATFSAYQRIDSQYHYLSDVVSGALIGVAFGHAVAGNHEVEILGMDVVPFVEPNTGAVGLALTKQW